MALIPSGELRHPIDIRSRSDTRGTRGQRTGSDDVNVSVFAKVEPLSGRELETARQRYGLATHLVTTWHPGFDVTRKHIVLYRGRTLSIGYVKDEDEMDQQIKMVCGEDV